MSRVNSMMVAMDADTGRTVGKLPIGNGSDAVVWDPTRKRLFSSNGADGMIAAHPQRAPDAYQSLEPVAGVVGGVR